IKAPSCKNGACTVSSTRPLLTATIDADPDSGYHFAVFDLSGPGGATTVVAEEQHVSSAQWAPAAGLLRHGHAYIWYVTGAEGELQETQFFTVDVQAKGRQLFDPAGPFSVGVSSGELELDIGDGQGLGLYYRSSDSAGRAIGATPFSVLSNGWRMGGSMVGAASWARVESFGDGETAVLHAMDGTAIRYERDNYGDYHPPRLNGVDIGFTYPQLGPAAGGHFEVRDSNGALSIFNNAGDLASFSRSPISGEANLTLNLSWANGRLVEVADSSTGKKAHFSYLGERDCPRPPPGFDRGNVNTPLCQVVYSDSSTNQLSAVKLYYAGGHLSRLVQDGGATLDFAYNAAGQLTKVREAIAADAVAAGVRANTDAAAWTIAYDKSARVATITSPQPEPDTAPLVRQYRYGIGITDVSLMSADYPEVIVNSTTYKVSDWSVLTSGAGHTNPVQYLYDDNDMLYGFVNSAGLQTSWIKDDFGNVIEQWGPAPSSWFDAEGRPLNKSAMAGSTSAYNENSASQGPLAFFYDKKTYDGNLVAQGFLNTMSAEDLPGSINGADGWRMLAHGIIAYDDAVDMQWKLEAANADANTVLSIGGAVCHVGEICQVPAAKDPQGVRTGNFYVNYTRSSAFTGEAGSLFTVQQSSTGGSSFTPLDLNDIQGLASITSTTSHDTLSLGGTVESITETQVYANQLLGTVSEFKRNGSVVRTNSYEAADPLAGQFARLIASTSASGLSLHTEYYGPNETAPHPVTGEPVHQSGAVKSVRMGDGKEHRRVHDAGGRIVGTWVDGKPVSTSLFDNRGRIALYEVQAGDDTVLSPYRSMEFIYGVEGDPLTAEMISTIGSRELVESYRIDLLGRKVEHIDSSNIRTTMHYDDRGLLSSTVHSQFIAGSWQVIKTVTTTFNDDLSIARVDAIDIAGGVHRADITEYDTSGREKQVEYSNNTRVTLNYDPVTGNLVELEWVDGNGERWVDTTVRSSQSGRILSHTLSSPSGTAAYEYGYQSGTRYLEWADLLGDGDVPSYSWHYEYAYDGEGACSNHNAAAALDGARTRRTTGSADGSVTLDYCYDEQLAPVQVRETTDSVLEGVSVRDVPLDLQDGAITRYESARLFYDIEEQLVRVEDGATTIQYIRDAAGNIVEEWIDTGEDTVVRRN
ncbi:hypothetical protein LCGC14_1574370, partial [marine sediment metagenome]